MRQSVLPATLASPVTEWRDVVGWEGLYEVSSTGQVRSVERAEVIDNRWGKCLRVKKGKVLKVHTRPDNYLSVRLKHKERGETVLVHRLVAFAYLGQPLSGEEVCHNDGNRANNSVVNLRWDTRSSNHQDKRAHGTICCGAKNAQCKLTEAAVLAIREQKGAQKKIANEYGISQQLASQIKARKIWTWLA